MYIAVCNPPIDTTTIRTFYPFQKRKITTKTKCGQTKNAPPLSHREVKSILHNPKLYKQIILATSLQQVSASVQTKRKAEVQYAISDSGATVNFLVQGAPVVNKKLTPSPLKTTPLNGNMIQSTHTCNLDIPWLPNTVTEAHIVPGLSHSSLMSTRKFTDLGCKVIFDID